MVKVCQAIGTNESTVRDRFNRNGYKRQGKQFVAIGDTVNTSNTNNISNTTNTNNISNTTNTNNTKVVNKANEKVREAKAKDNNIKVLENRIGNLEKELEQLKAMVLSNTNNTIEMTDIGNDSNTREIIKYDTNDLVSRNYKIDKEVADKFVKFCKLQKLTNDYKVSDLATNALVEYMNKFNK